MRVFAAACLAALGLVIVAPAPRAELRHVSSRLFAGEASEGMNQASVGFPFHNLATNGNGVFLIAFTGGTMSFGGPFVGPGAVAARLGAADAPAIWGRVLYTVASGGAVIISSAALADDGSVALAGEMLGTVDLGGGPMTSYNGTYDAFVMMLNPDGSLAWQHRYGTQFGQVAKGVAFADNGDVLVIGSNSGQIDFGGGNMISNGAADVVVARLGRDGAHRWSHEYGQVGAQDGYAIATAPHGDVVLLCNLGTGGIDFGGGLLLRGGGNIVLAVLDADGNHVSSRTIGGSGGGNPADMAVDKDGNVFICGSFGRSMDRGDGTLLISRPTSSTSGFLVSFDAGGTYRWSYALLDTLSARALAVGTSSINECVMAGWTREAPGITGFDVPACRFFMMVFDSVGTVEDARGFGEPTSFPGVYMCMRDDDVYLAGSTASSVDFGGGWLDPAPPSDIFLAHLALRRPPQVTIANFAARARGTDVELLWNVTGGEPAAEFYLSRRDAGSSRSSIIYFATAAEAADRFMDRTTEPGHAYHYELTVETALGDPVSRSTSISVPAITTTLGQNAPNPFNPLTTFPYTLAAPAQVTIAIYDLSGALIAKLDQGMQPAGRHEAKWAGHNWEGNPVSSGVYFYRLEGAGDVPARKMVLLK